MPQKKCYVCIFSGIRATVNSDVFILTILANYAEFCEQSQNYRIKLKVHFDKLGMRLINFP